MSPEAYPVRLGRYVFRHYLRLATPLESGGWQIAIYAETHGGRLSMQVMVPVERRAAAVALLANGVDAFYATAGRCVVDRHRADVYLNFCPRCGHLCLTPKAQQCFQCSHDWHPGQLGRGQTVAGGSTPSGKG